MALEDPLHHGSFALPVSAPPSPPPPPSPAFLSPFSRHVALPHRVQHQTVFDLESSSPLSFTGAEKTTLKAQLERASKTKVLLREGKPARPLTKEEQLRLALEEQAGDWSTTSSGSRTRGGRSALASGTEDGSDWLTEDEGEKEQTATGVVVAADDLAPQQGGMSYFPPADVRGGSGALIPSGLVGGLSSSPKHSTVPPSPSTVPSFPPTLFPSCRTTTAPSRSPASHLSTLLSRQRFKPTADGTAVFPCLSPTPPSNPFPSRQTANPGGTWNGGPLAAALAAAEKMPESAPRPVAQCPLPSNRSPMAPVKKKPLSKTKSLPTAPPPSPASSAASPLRACSSESSSPPRPPIARLAPSSSFPLAASNRYFFNSRLSSPNVSPPLPPLPSSSIMDTRHAKDLTLHFARRPDMPRKGSMGESFQRFMRGAPTGSDGRRRRESLGPIGTDADVESTDTELEELEEQSGFEHFEPSVFASPRSNSAASLSSASSTFIHSRSVSATPSGSAASSVHASPKVTTTSLSSVFSLPSPILLAAPLPPPVVAAPLPSRPLPSQRPSSGIPLQRTRPQPTVDFKQLRQQQQARRAQLEAEAGESSSPSSAFSATDIVDNSPSPTTRPSAYDPAPTAASTPSISPSHPRWATASPATIAASVVTSKEGEAVLLRRRARDLRREGELR
ncbi:hypothetical protein JCM11251_000104 [Rhodosporidiobolus azoricus]